MRVYTREKESQKLPSNKDLVNRGGYRHNGVHHPGQGSAEVESKFRYVCMYTDDNPNNKYYGSSSENTVKETISMVLLKQFTHPSKKWLLSCHFED